MAADGPAEEQRHEGAPTEEQQHEIPTVKEIEKQLEEMGQDNPKNAALRHTRIG